MNKLEKWKRAYWKIDKYQQEVNQPAPQGAGELMRWFHENARSYKENRLGSERLELWEKLKFKLHTPQAEKLFNFFKLNMKALKQHQEETGHFSPRVSENQNLYRFYRRSRKQAEAGIMPPERLELWNQLPVKYPGRIRTSQAKMKNIAPKRKRAGHE